MFIQNHVLLILAVLVLAMNALGLGFTIHRNLQAQAKQSEDERKAHVVA